MTRWGTARHSRPRAAKPSAQASRAGCGPPQPCWPPPQLPSLSCGGFHPDLSNPKPTHPTPPPSKSSWKQPERYAHVPGPRDESLGEGRQRLLSTEQTDRQAARVRGPAALQGHGTAPFNHNEELARRRRDSDQAGLAVPRASHYDTRPRQEGTQGRLPLTTSQRHGVFLDTWRSCARHGREARVTSSRMTSSLAGSAGLLLKRGQQLSSQGRPDLHSGTAGGQGGLVTCQAE